MESRNEDSQENDEEYDYDAEQIIRDFADNKIMDRVQKAIFDRISKEKYRLEVQLREKLGELKNTQQSREQLGVELYSFQQQLAKMQLELETIHSDCITEAETRNRSESDLAEVRKDFTKEREVLSIERDKLIKSQAELDAVNATIHQVEEYNTQMKGEIAVVRRVAYKAEELINNMEKGKSVQD